MSCISHSSIRCFRAVILPKPCKPREVEDVTCPFRPGCHDLRSDGIYLSTPRTTSSTSQLQPPPYATTSTDITAASFSPIGCPVLATQHDLVKNIINHPISKASLSLIVEYSPTGMLVVDRDGSIMLCNADVIKMFGYSSSDELIGQKLEILVPDRFHRQHGQYRNMFLASPSKRMMGVGRESFGKRRDGSEFHVEIGLNHILVSNEPTANESQTETVVSAAVVDISERKRLEERFKLMVRSAPNGMIMIDTAGTIVLANPQADLLFGYPAHELIGQKVEILVPDRSKASHPSLRDSFVSSPSSRPMGAGRDLYAVKKDGSEVPVEIGLTPVDTTDGSFVLASIVDITERKQMEKLRRDIEVAERENQVRSRILATMSHEIRTPLTGLMGTIELIAMIPHMPEEATELFKTTQLCSDSLMSIINDILDFSKLEAGKTQAESIPFQIQCILLDVHSIVSTKLRSTQLSWSVNIDPTVPETVIGDKVHLRQAILNLVSNAIKFTKQGGVKISVSLLKSSPEPFTSSNIYGCDGARLKIHVEDSGIGIPDAIKPRLFQPFVQGDTSVTRTSGGTGLGLAITARLAKLMGGTISVAKAPETGGSIFTLEVLVKIPLVDKMAMHSTSIQKVSEKVITNKAPVFKSKPSHISNRILLAEDDLICQKIMVALLSKLGYHDVVTCKNGQEVLDTLLSNQSNKSFDVILMDCEMPLLDGFATTVEIRRRNIDIPIIAITANSMVEDRERCLRHGMNDYMAKPVTFQTLSKFLSTWMPVKTA